MNQCEKWAFCPLGDMAKIIKCRKPNCPKSTIGTIGSPLIYFVKLED